MLTCGLTKAGLPVMVVLSTSGNLNLWKCEVRTSLVSDLSLAYVCMTFLPPSSGESQTLLAAAVERERAATEELLANKTQMSSVESQNSLLRQENSRLQAQLESEKNKLRKLEDENSR